MKILYIGHYRDKTGYGEAAENYILALNHIGIDVVARPFRLNNNKEPIPKTIENLEDKISDGCDVCIQHTLPTFYEYDGNFRKNIGMVAIETNSVPLEWVYKCNMMDTIITFTNSGKSALKNSGVNVPIYVLPHTFDINKYRKEYKPTELRKNYQNDFLFYTIGEFVTRKDYETLIRAFHLAFHPSDLVQLIIKSNVPGKSPEESLKIISEFCNAIKLSMGLYPSLEDYKKEILIVHRLPEDAIQAIHNDCDCFVTTSHGEAWCIPAWEAQIAHGNNLIAGMHTAFNDWMLNTDFCGVSTNLVPANDPNSPNGIYNSRNTWWQLDIIELVKIMQRVYNDKKNQSSITKDFLRKGMDHYSYENVGVDFLKILND